MSFGPNTEGTPPAGTTWLNGFPHDAFFDMSAYYIQAFKTGTYPSINVGAHTHSIYATD
jgi:glucan endo-1,3-alpha-glucosidase